MALLCRTAQRQLGCAQLLRQSATAQASAGACHIAGPPGFVMGVVVADCQSDWQPAHPLKLPLPRHRSIATWLWVQAAARRALSCTTS